MACEVWNGLFFVFLLYLSGDIMSMEQVEQVNLIFMKLCNSSVTALC